MTIPEKAVQWAVGIANDNSHGYDQGSRWGPDYDCSSLVISAYKAAGVALNCTYTGNMRSDMLLRGFVPAPVNLATGDGLQPGDVLLNQVHHTAMYIGNGKLVQASINERGGVTGGKTGDQTGGEINIHAYYNFPWDMALRYVRKEDGKAESQQEPVAVPTGKTGKYTVRKGDTLWGIAERMLGDGSRYIQIMTANNMTDSMIYPGEVLIIPTDNTYYRTVQITIANTTHDKLTKMATESDQTIGQIIDGLVTNS